MSSTIEQPVDQTAAMVASGRDSLVVYSLLVDPRYRANRFHRYLARELEKAVAAGHCRIMIFAPPQHGKSEIVSRKLPAWIMGKHPDWPIIGASYGDDLVELNGGSVRGAVSSPMHRAIFPGSVLDPSTTAKANFSTTEGGKYLGVTIRGGGTGFPAKVFIIDDPFKSRAEADSDTFREHVKNWYRSVVYTRLAEDSILIVMHTRWHDDDLAGWLLREHQHEDWHVISLPAIAEEDDELGRKPGEALVPERFSSGALDKKRLAVGSREWLALFQGKPPKKGGGTFLKDWLRYYNAKDVMQAAWMMNRYLVIDPARTQKKNSDYTAMHIIGLHMDSNYYLLDTIYDKLTLKQRAEGVIELHRKWKPAETGYKKTGHEQDIEYLLEAQGRENYRFKVIALSEVGEKNPRIERLAPDFEAERWWFPETMWKTGYDGHPRDLIAQFVNDEYLPFPAGRHDDFFDGLSGIKDMPTKWPSVGPNRTRTKQQVMIV
ncbi:putative phage terminase large subunit-like protein [Paraburkholderia sp. MM5496-R1]|uniref:phage terminase large subunit n=1 Tax=Paraburkholderia sp. MM5496-R1 TaxID=2991065 RepID=UPI003D1A9452